MNLDKLMATAEMAGKALRVVGVAALGYVVVKEFKGE